MIHDLNPGRNFSENVFLPFSMPKSIIRHSPLTKEKVSFSGKKKKNPASLAEYVVWYCSSLSLESHGSEVCALKKDKHLTVMRID